MNLQRHNLVYGSASHIKRGERGIGHVRYSTFGSSTIENAQPIVVSTNYGDIALCHNGEIVNADKIMDELKKKGWAFITSSDSEIAVRLLANDIANTGDPVKSLKNLMSMLQGSYSMTIMIDNRVFAIRDPLGIRPLCIGRTKTGYAAASESVVFDTLGGEFIRDVEPGEIVEMLPGEIKSIKTGLAKGQGKPDCVLLLRLMRDMGLRRQEVQRLTLDDDQFDGDITRLAVKGKGKLEKLILRMPRKPPPP